MEQTAHENKMKKFEIVLSVVFTILFLGLAAALFAYSYFRFYSPLKSVDFSRPDATTVVVNVTSGVKLKTKVEYGTTDLYLNQTATTDTFETSHSHTIWGLLPNKQHFFRVISEDEQGKVYTSKFYKY